MWYPLWHRMWQRTKEIALRPVKVVLSWLQYRQWLSPFRQSSPEELRQMQRQFDVAVLLVHHARKGGGKARAGQALRGSSEFHAWGDYPARRPMPSDVRRIANSP